nr:MAG TPA: hypothetical protein [Caudoviricetes sp.]
MNVALIRTFVKENIPCVKYMRYIFFRVDNFAYNEVVTIY